MEARQRVVDEAVAKRKARFEELKRENEAQINGPATAAEAEKDSLV